MCTFASIVLTKDNAFWALHDNHSQIIADNKLVETVAGRVTLVRIELTPPNNNYSAPLDQWRYRVDQDLLPEWYEPDATEERARRAFCELAAKRILREGKHEVCEGSYVVVDNATVTADGRATVTAYDSATVTADDNATVTADGRATVTACDNATVTAYDSATVTAYGNATVTAYDSATVTAYDSATVTAYGRATVTAYGRATVTADKRATVVQYGGTVELTAEAACVDRRGPCVVCHTAAPPR
jgi:hypothetical protein